MIEAIILIVARPGKENEVYDTLRVHPGVKEIYRVYGEYDILLRIEVEDIKGLDSFHDGLLRKLGEGDVELTETLIASTYGIK